MRVVARRAADLLNERSELPGGQGSFDELLGVRRDEEGLPERLEAAEPLEQRTDFDAAIDERRDDRARVIGEPTGQRDGQGDRVGPIAQVDGDPLSTVGACPRVFGELFDVREHLHDVLARPQRVDLEVGAAAVRDAARFPA